MTTRITAATIIAVLRVAGCTIANPERENEVIVAAPATSPVVTALDALPREQLSPDIVRQALHGDLLTLSR